MVYFTIQVEHVLVPILWMPIDFFQNPYITKSTQNMAGIVDGTGFKALTIRNAKDQSCPKTQLCSLKQQTQS